MNTEGFLMHHGIQGQKWGVRNGPPYPLSRAKSTGKRLKDSGGKKASNKEVGSLTALVTAGILVWDALVISALVGTYASIGAKAVRSMVRKNKALKKIDEEKSKLKTDPKTGFKLKEKEATEEEDVKAVNAYAEGYKGGRGGNNNCMSCTTAYELRRRGYEVYAESLTQGFNENALKEWWKGGKLVQSKANPKGPTERSLYEQRAKLGENTQFAKDLISELKKLPNGSRGNLCISWSSYSGHSIIYEIKDGNLIIRDGQVNKNYKTDKELEKLLSRACDATYMRTDNLKMNEKKIKEVVKWKK